jgi:hypothetical protein
MVVMLWKCPDCGITMCEGQVAHQHQDGEWVYTSTIREWYQLRRWGRDEIERLRAENERLRAELDLASDPARSALDEGEEMMTEIEAEVERLRKDKGVRRSQERNTSCEKDIDELVADARIDEILIRDLRAEIERLRADERTINDSWRDQFDLLQATRRELEADNAKLRAALEFYADPQTYHAIMFVPDRPCGEFIEDFDEEHGDGFYKRPMPGKQARRALGVSHTTRT